MTENYIKYWRNSLADGERMEQNLQKLDHFKIEWVDLEKGTLPSAEVNLLIDNYELKVNREKGIENRDDDDWIEIGEISIIIAPFAILPKYEHGKKVTERDNIYPFWLNARVNRYGYLSIPDIKFPVFIRKVLEPTVKEDQLIILSSVEKVDQIMSEGNSDIEDWADYWIFITSIFEKVTGQELSSFSVDELTIKNETIVALDEKMDGAGDGIIKLYDQLLEEERIPALLSKLSITNCPIIKSLIPENNWPSIMYKHLGQMGNKFPLSFTQRQSLIHYNSLENGDLMAVNGPPGTGKTTLLQSVVAHEYVKAAIMGKDPFIMVASSTNNQAVTNIIESFSKADSTHKLLSERWLPDINSYALYLPSSSMIPNDGVHYAQINREGLPSTIEKPEYIDKAKEFFIEKAEIHFGESFDDVESATNYLQGKLKLLDNRLKKIQHGWKNYLEILNLLETYSSTKSSIFFKCNALDRQAINMEASEVSRLLEAYYVIKESESFWLVLFSFLKFFKEKRAIPYKRLFQSSKLQIFSPDYNDINQIEEILLQKLDLLNKVISLDDQWSNLKSSNALESNPPSLFDELDLGLRHEAFLLATHYWEGRWILEADQVVTENIHWKSMEPDMIRRYKRYAMLTPCFVSTFYMLPKFFSYKKYGEKNTLNQFPLLNFVDLLIVDEAGQVTPEVGAASFALAKKALVVGDIKQIDPIWKIPKPIDHSNLSKFKLLTLENKFDDLDEKGFTASAGSIMKLAQNASYYHAAVKEARGMMLVEHRRCYNEIIDFCNNLAYHGLLKPMRGSYAKHEVKPPLPAMGFIDILGNSISENGSRLNEEEAIAIANWLLENHDLINNFYFDSKNPEKKLEEHIGIITPFASQKHLLKNIIKTAGFDTKKLTIGTVHALQGAERSIIIFSPVYASNEEGRSFFFDRGVNMLNVAVSRAKDSFLLFGDTSIYDQKSSTPSGMLMRYLKTKGKNISAE
ncbi:DNA helicase [Marivirga lumbricoides]|uniref:DNA helicase n=1 Tax=Marivirga lumbricoides TaxID=1046115 RepID=A0ABQ1MQD4_9BACT|nr:DNA helicase [Marivirga lumbricoides]